MYENGSYVLAMQMTYSCSWKRNVFCSSADIEDNCVFLLKTCFQSFSCFDKIKIRGGQICCYSGEPELYYLVLDKLKICHIPHQIQITMFA